jgi:hypothetical protein
VYPELEGGVLARLAEGRQTGRCRVSPKLIEEDVKSVVRKL